MTVPMRAKKLNVPMRARIAARNLRDDSLRADPGHVGGKADQHLQCEHDRQPRQQRIDCCQGAVATCEEHQHPPRAEPVHQRAAMNGEKERQQRTGADQRPDLRR